jgi:hypothetical protein
VCVNGDTNAQREEGRPRSRLLAPSELRVPQSSMCGWWGRLWDELKVAAVREGVSGKAEVGRQ